MIVADTNVLIDALRGRAVARVRLELEAAGRPIGMADYLIAGICRVNNGFCRQGIGGTSNGLAASGWAV